jgi:hypothetical protein
VAAIFAFDPTRPSNNGAGVGYESDDYGGGYGGSNKGYSEYEKKVHFLP